VIEVRLNRLILVENQSQQVLRLEEAHPSPGNPPRRLVMFIGPREAGEIGRVLKGQETPRPLTHQLLAAVIRALGAQVEKMVVNRVSQGKFYAELYLRREESLQAIDCRPSDAIALSLRMGTPIYVTEEVMEQAGSPA